MTTEEAKRIYDELTSVTPTTMEELLHQYDLLHEVACAKGHMPICDEPVPLDWTPLVLRLASVRAQIWRQFVFGTMLANGDAGDPHDLETMTPDVMPPDTTSHFLTNDNESS